MKFETSVELSKEKVCRVNNLLLIEDMEEMTDDELLKAGATVTLVNAKSVQNGTISWFAVKAW